MKKKENEAAKWAPARALPPSAIVAEQRARRRAEAKRKKREDKLREKEEKRAAAKAEGDAASSSGSSSDSDSDSDVDDSRTPLCGRAQVTAHQRPPPAYSYIAALQSRTRS